MKMSRITNQIKKHWLFITILILFFSWIFYSYFTEGIFYLLATSDTNSVVEFINSFGFFAIVIFVLLVILEVVLAPIPPLVLYLAGGIIFGAFLGGTLTLVGNVLGAIIAFYVARRYGRKSVEKKVPIKLRRNFDDFSKKYGAFALFLLRLNPLTTSDIFSYIAGLTKMKTRKFILSTALGLAPLIFFQTYVGEIFVKDNPFLTLVFLAIGIFYVAIFLYGLWYLVFKKVRTKKN